MTVNLIAGIVRILDSNDQTAGAGFILTADGLIATCAHVVESAGAGPGDRIHLIFHLTGAEVTAIVEPEGWCAPESEDVAILRLEMALSKEVMPFPLGLSANSAHHPFETFGFPDANLGGLLGSGQILGKTTLNGVPVLQLQSQEVTPGFSGAPIWDTAIQRIVGMVTAITTPDKYGRMAQTAFATPAETLLASHPDLAKSLLPTSIYSFHLNTAPKPPGHFVQRPVEFEQLISYLLHGEETRTVAITTALQGGGGFGKTTLATAICHDPRIADAFPDGILWIELGQRPDLLGLLAAQIALLDPEQATPTDLNLAKTSLQKLLTNRRVLLVMDDVWDDAAIQPFLPGEPHCATLITTRRQDLVVALKAKPVTVNEMDADEAVELLCKWFDEPPAKLQPVRELARYLGEWPLLLNLAGAYLREMIEIERQSLSKAMAGLRKRLERRGFTYLDQTDANERNKAISFSLDLSMKRLGRWRNRYLEFAIFPEDTDIPFVTVAKLWAQTANLDDMDTEDALRAMQRLSLFIDYNPLAQTVRLHSIIRDYLAQQCEDLPALHTQFLSAFQPSHHPELKIPDQASPYSELTWANLPHNEPYLWDHLAYHLAGAGRGDELNTSVKDPSYLTTKAYVRRTYAVETDLIAAEQNNPNDAHIRLLRHFFANAGHILNKCQTLNDLAATLHSRLQHLEDLSSFNQWLARTLTPPYLTSWHPLPDLPHPLLIRTLLGHGGPVGNCAISGDNLFIVSASSDNTLKIWETSSGREKMTMTGHTDLVSDCIISPDSSLIVSASSDKTLKIWDAVSGRVQLTLSGHTDRVNACAISPDGSVIVSASSDKTLKIWDVATGAVRRTLSGHTDRVNTCAISPDGSFIVSASSDKTLKIWDVATGAVRHTLSGDKGHTNQVNGCVISPDGSFVVSASGDQTLKIWDVVTGEVRGTLSGHLDHVNSCAISADGTFIVSASSDKTLKIWDIITGSERLSLTGHTDWVNSCLVSPDNSLIVSTALDGTIKIWDASEWKRVRIIRQFERANGCAISPDGLLAVSTGADCTLKLWETFSGHHSHTLTGHVAQINSCVFSSDGLRIVSASDDQTLKIWDVPNKCELFTLTGHTALVSDCAMSQDGLFVVSASHDNTLKLWGPTTGHERLTLTSHTDWVNGCCVSADNSLIISASFDHTLKIWDVATGRERITLTGHTNIVMDCDISRDGRWVISASYDNTLVIWEVSTGRQVRTLTEHTSCVNGCAFSPDNSFIASASDDCTLRVWDTYKGDCLTTLWVDGPLRHCTWCPNGEYIVAVGELGVYFLRFVY